METFDSPVRAATGGKAVWSPFSTPTTAGEVRELGPADAAHRLPGGEPGTAKAPNASDAQAVETGGITIRFRCERPWSTPCSVATERNPSEPETLREPSGNMTQRTGSTSRIIVPATPIDPRRAAPGAPDDVDTTDEQGRVVLITSKTNRATPGDLRYEGHHHRNGRYRLCSRAQYNRGMILAARTNRHCAGDKLPLPPANTNRRLQRIVTSETPKPGIG